MQYLSLNCFIIVMADLMEENPLVNPVEDNTEVTPKPSKVVKVINNVIQYLFLNRPHYARYVAVITDWPWEIATYVTGTKRSIAISNTPKESTNCLSCVQLSVCDSL